MVKEADIRLGRENNRFGVYYKVILELLQDAKEFGGLGRMPESTQEKFAKEISVNC